MNWRIRIVLPVILAAMAATPAGAQSAPRRVVVVAQPDDPRGPRQQALLAADAAALHDRDVVVETITQAAARQRPALGLAADAPFAVLLVGRDGGVKRRWAAPVPPAEITALIDTMPMRQAEMRRR